jgi:hypothetical protein
MKNLVKIIFLIATLFVKAPNVVSQNKGELVGSNKKLTSQNYKLPSKNLDKFELAASKYLKTKEFQSLIDQKKAKEELPQSHILKQTKSTVKRMKLTLKKSQRLKAGKHIIPFWRRWLQNKKKFLNIKKNKMFN